MFRNIFFTIKSNIANHKKLESAAKSFARCCLQCGAVSQFTGLLGISTA
jgi:hypothetical protein